jgi:hypothetical protein
MGLPWQHTGLPGHAVIDGTRLRLEPGQAVVPHGIDRDLTLDEAAGGPSR